MAIASTESTILPSEEVDPADRLIVALDVSSKEKAEDLVAQLDGIVSFFKIGLQLQLVSDQAFLERLISKNKRIFLDYKYFDIGRTVKEAVVRAASFGVSFLTVHGNSDIIKAAVEGRGSSSLKILSVTVLTSLDQKDLEEMGFNCSVRDLVLHRARKAKQAGCDGVIASGQEARDIRREIGKDLLIVTPGIRPDGEPEDDQKRSTTPAQAISEGADYLVIGRPIYDRPDPKTATLAIIEQMRNGFRSRLA